ncbi:hypothetical protein D3C87_1319150 [compost metagenome]
MQKVVTDVARVSACTSEIHSHSFLFGIDAMAFKDLFGVHGGHAGFLSEGFNLKFIVHRKRDQVSIENFDNAVDFRLIGIGVAEAGKETI